MDNLKQRNMILALALMGVLLLGWDYAVSYLYPQPKQPLTAPAAQASSAPTREGGLTSVADIAAEARDLRSVLAKGGRVPIKAPGLSGSINLEGGLVDDLTTNRHTAQLEKKSGAQRIFSPAGTPAQYFAQFGWVGSGAALPGPATVWSVPQGAALTPQSPVTLTWANGAGQIYALSYEIDADYMITATQAITNSGQAAVVAQPFALINRTEKTASIDGFNVHSGPFGAFDQAVSFAPDYDDVGEAKQIENKGKTDWIGFTDIYWMATLVPDQAPATSAFRAQGQGIYRADLVYGPSTIGPGQTLTRTTRLFAGAKESAVLDRYEAAGIPQFGLAIDWGWFRWFEKPIFWLLTKLDTLVGNFGLAIILLTLIVRIVMFPIAQRQFASMAAMKAIQPKMKALQDRYKDDKQKQQQEIMALYKQEGVNPLAGCLPIFLQIPVFFALYKVLTLAIEMRHEPFALWIKDLSAPDPLHFLNLFGALPYEVPAFLGIGILALLLGVTMYYQFKLNPAQMDPVQQQMFAIMPWIMMFIMAPFAAGLLIYWITSNVLTIAQQWYLYSRHPQLKAQAEKETTDAERAKTRGK